jgi:hypothetical protein
MYPSRQRPDDTAPWTDVLPWSEAPPPAEAGYGYLEPRAAARQRARGLGRVGRLTWRASQLGALAAVGFAAAFARSAPAQTVSSRPSPTPSGSRAVAAAPPYHQRPAHHPRARHRHRHRAAAPAAAPASPAAAPAPTATPTLAPPTTPPAPPPPTASPTPKPTISSHSVSGG